MPLFALEAADWESMAELACCRQGQQTRTSWPMKIIQQPGLIYLFLSLYLIWQWNQRWRIQDTSLSFIPTSKTQEVCWGFLSAGCVRFQVFLPAMTFLGNDFFFFFLPFLIFIEATQSGKRLIKCRLSLDLAKMVVTCDLTDSDGPWGPGRQMGERDDCWFFYAFFSPFSSSLSPFFCVRDAAPEWVRWNFRVPAEERWAAHVSSPGERANPAVTPRRHTTLLRFPNCLIRPKASLLNFCSPSSMPE